MTAPDKIWIDPNDSISASMEWRGAKYIDWSEEYTRSDLIPAMLAEARAEALREAYAKIEAMWASTTREHMDAILALIDAPAPAPAQPSVREVVRAYVKARLYFHAIPTDRGGARGRKGQANARMLEAFDALRALAGDQT